MHWNFGPSRFGFAAVAVGSALSALVFQASVANATVFTTTETIGLNVGNTAIASTGPGPYGQFEIGQIGGTLAGGSTTFELIATGINGYVFGDHEIIDLNLNTTSASLTTGGTNTGTLAVGGTVTGVITAATFDSAHPQQVDGFGKFNFVMDDGSGFSSGGYSSITIDFTTGTTVTLANLLTVDDKGVEAAAHVAPAANTTCTGYIGNTGPAGTSTDTSTSCSTSVPEPASLGIFGAALAGLGLIRRRRRQNAS